MDRQRRAAAISVALITLLIGLVCARSWVPVRTYAHFDSDQAVYGFMAKDLLAGRGFPMFFYGQRYLLGVSVWLCAPLFAIFGVSIVTLKLPMFLMNIAAVLMLWVGFRRDGLGWWGTTLAILPFAMPSAVVSTRLVEMAGGNIEPIVFVLAAFFLRERPVALGIVLGVAFLNREYTLSALVALLLLDAAGGRLVSKLKPHLITLTCFAGVVGMLRIVARWSNEYVGSFALYRRPNWDNVAGLFGQQLPTLIGGAPRRLGDFNIFSSLTVGHAVVYYAVVAWVLLVALRLMRRPPPRSEINSFSAYLVFVGTAQLAAFLLLSPYPRDIMVVRYILVTLLALCGLVALAWRRPVLRPATAAVILLMTAVNLTGNLRLIHEYAINSMQRPLNQLADALVERRVRYAQADYWTAFDVTWVTGERVVVSPPRGFGNRLARFSDLLDAHRGEVFTISNTPGQGCQSIARWYVCR